MALGLPFWRCYRLDPCRPLVARVITAAVHAFTSAGYAGDAALDARLMAERPAFRVVNARSGINQAAAQ